MAEIADAVGIRAPSLYYHFSDKADVLRALAGEGTLRDSLKLRTDISYSVPHRLYLLVHALVFRFRSSPYELNCLFDPTFHDKEFNDVNLHLRA